MAEPSAPQRATPQRATPSADSTGLRRTWLVACIVGELVGFIPPALTGALLVSLGVAEPVLVLGLVIAGVGEGAVLGSIQQQALRPVVPVDGWASATAIGAGLAWLAGMGGSSLVGAIGPVALIGVAPAWVVGLLAMPVLQRRRLRAAGLSGTRVWITRSVLAWTVGVAIPVVALSIVPNGAPLVAHIAVAILAAVAMGATVGVITGRCLEQIVAPLPGQAGASRSVVISR